MRCLITEEIHYTIPLISVSDIPLFVPKVKKTITYIVMAIVFDDQDRVVFVQEAKSSCRGKWYLPAGRVEKGENLIVGFGF